MSSPGFCDIDMDREVLNSVADESKEIRVSQLVSQQAQENEELYRRLNKYEIQLAESTVARAAAEDRCNRLEREVVSLRELLSSFGERMVRVAECHSPLPVRTSSFLLQETSDLVTPDPQLITVETSSRTRSRLSRPRTEESDSNDTRATKKQRRKWDFNPVWQTQYHWLEYDEESRQMGCSICRMAGEKSRWGKMEISRLRIGSVRIHNIDKKHLKNVRSSGTVSPSIESNHNDIPPHITDDDLIEPDMTPNSTGETFF